MASMRPHSLRLGRQLTPSSTTACGASSLQPQMVTHIDRSGMRPRSQATSDHQLLDFSKIEEYLALDGQTEHGQ
jgi:hypothetical protein